ncbi:hypothetical protein Pan97_35460 [Bremerella volcania]|uniref:Uncharacterized protein n=1 Tax=Bremerella volcania TaxID=2527984 RepID=A0A518CBB0_9BACT|nr:hypothetical protein [Bremerella volcania]QDU76496.1 hypothetical protein Pan97_35460 [Bremerella volcania]
MSLTKDIYRAFKTLRKEHAFVPAKPIGGSRHAALSRLEEDDILVSLVALEETDEMATVDLWITPMDVPDGALDRLNVGYRIWIGAEVMPVNEEFLEGCEARVIALLPSVGALIPPLRQELKKPPIRTLKWKVFQHQEELRRLVLELAVQKQAGAATTLEKAVAYAGGKMILREFSEECERISSEILKRGVLSNGAAKFYEGDLERVTHTMYRALFAWGLGELSRRLQ